MTTNRTLSATFGRALAHTFIMVMLPFTGMLLMDDQQAVVQEDITLGLPAPKGSPRAVLEAHSDVCWDQHEAALSEVPSAAIIRWNKAGGQARYTKDHDLVDAAFKEVLSSMGYGEYEDARFKVIALCI